MAVDTDHRLKAGTLSQYAIENDATAVVEDFTRQSDQPTAVQWMMVGVDGVIEGEFVGGLDGNAGAFGGESGEIEFFQLTWGMVNYLWTNVFQSKYSNNVTLRVFHQRRGWTVYNAVLHWPPGWRDSVVMQTQDLQSNVRFAYTRAAVAAYGRAYSSAYSSAYG